MKCGSELTNMLLHVHFHNIKMWVLEKLYLYIKCKRDTSRKKFVVSPNIIHKRECFLSGLDGNITHLDFYSYQKCKLHATIAL